MVKDRPVRRIGFFAYVAASIICASCATEEPGISQSPEEFYFPTGLALDLNLDDSCTARDPLLFVSNSNTDLRYNGGTIEALDVSILPGDLSAVADAVSAGELDCHPSAEASYRWECPSEQFVLRHATRRVGDFPGELRLGHNNQRLFTPVRVEPWSLTWMDIERVDDPERKVELHCGPECDSTMEDVLNAEGEVEKTIIQLCDCDDAHKVIKTAASAPMPDVELPEEPFGILLHQPSAIFVDDQGVRQTCQTHPGIIDCECGSTARCDTDRVVDCCIPAEDPDAVHIYIAHASHGEVSYFQSHPGGEPTETSSPVELRDVLGDFFEPIDPDDEDADNPDTESFSGAFGLAATVLGDPESPIYVSSRVDNILGAFVIKNNRFIVDGAALPMTALDPGDDVRGLAFDPIKERLYLVSRRPSTLTAMDMSLEGGLPRRETLWSTPICAQPSLLRLSPDPVCLLRENEECPARGTTTCPLNALLFVVCYEEAQIVVLDTVVGEIRGVIFTGAGPYAMEFDLRPQDDALRGYVTNFLDNTIGVIDLDPRRDTYLQMVLRIGRAQLLLQAQ